MNYKIGFLNVNKPPNCTSHDVVIKLRKSLGIKRIGHIGTLDPFATGVLVVGINEATRLFEYLDSDKTYIAGITFGIDTDTNDITGNIVHKNKNFPTLEEIKFSLQKFIGKIKQKPPVFSSIKINGKRAYNLARKNEITLNDIQEKEIEVYSIDVLEYTVGAIRELSLLQLKIHCSKGTYIRSIARDLGKELNTCAVLSSLERIKVGKYFTIENSIDLEKINKNTLKEHLIKPSEVLTIPKVELNDLEIKNISYGRNIPVETRLIVPLQGQNNYVQLFNNKNTLIGIGEITNDCIIKPKKVIVKNGY